MLMHKPLNQVDHFETGGYSHAGGAMDYSGLCRLNALHKSFSTCVNMLTLLPKVNYE